MSVLIKGGRVVTAADDYTADVYVEGVSVTTIGVSLHERGIPSYKLFMAYKGASMVDDETLFRTMQVAARTGALVMVHAENGDAIDVLVKEALAAGHTEPRYHALTRPPETDTRL